MEHFIARHKLSAQDPIVNKIRDKIVVSGAYQIHSFTLDVPKGQTEDSVYSKYPRLLDIVHRAEFYLVHGKELVTVIQGPRKFSGHTQLDEDPEDGEEDAQNTIYHHAETIEWAQRNQLNIVETEKANGKFVILQLFFHNDKNHILCGTKTMPFLTSMDQIHRDIEANKNTLFGPILISIRDHYEDLLTLGQWFSQGFSLVGELCDGQHFMPGDNRVTWFGMFKGREVIDTVLCLETLRHRGIPTVRFQTVFTPKSNISELDNVFLRARCKNSEGSVLYLENLVTNKKVLVKSKSIMYIVKRFVRQVILRGYMHLESLQGRFVEAAAYHGLNTDASIRITKQLYRFGFWMMEKKFSVSVLGHMNQGFYHYWKMFLDEGNEEIVVQETDLSGSFNKNEYLEGTVLYEKRTYSKPAEVYFIQGLQGCGKSTFGEELAKRIPYAKNIDQDMYGGDTLACQGALFHMISSKEGPQTIFLSRCNLNPKQYSRYLDMCHRLPCVVRFLSPQTVNPLYLAVSLAGIMTRSNMSSEKTVANQVAKNADNWILGNSTLPATEVVKIVQTNYREYVQHEPSTTYVTFRLDQDLLEEASRTKDMLTFVKANCERLMALRYSVHHTLCSIEPDGTPVVPSRPVYVGAAVDRYHHRANLIKYLPHSDTHKTYVDHMTIRYFGKEKPDMVPFLPGQIIYRRLDALVIRKSDGASAFRIIPEGGDKPNPHITAQVAVGGKPEMSNAFVGLTDDSVTIVPMDFTVEMTVYWYSSA